MTAIEIIFLVIVIFSIVLIVYNIIYPSSNFINANNNVKTANKVNDKVNVKDFDNIPIFNTLQNQKIEKYYLIKQNNKDFEERKEDLKEIVDKENKEIDNFNIDYFNFYDRINNTTTNYNNANDKLHLLNKFNNFDSKETNNKTIREIYNQIVN